MSEVMPFVSASENQLQAAGVFKGLAPRPYEEMLADIELVNDVEQLPFGVPESVGSKLSGMVTKIGALAMRGVEKVVDTASALKIRSEIAVADMVDNAGKIVPHVALAGLALGGAGGLMALESGNADAASISFGKNIYVNFNRSETQRIENLKDNYGTTLDYAGIACGFIGNRALAVACGATAYYKKQQFNHAVDEAKARGECLQFVQPYWAAGSPVTNWFSVTPCPRIPGGRENGLPVA